MEHIDLVWEKQCGRCCFCGAALNPSEGFVQLEEGLLCNCCFEKEILPLLDTE